MAHIGEAREFWILSGVWAAGFKEVLCFVQ